MKTFMFPGQGSQSKGMGEALFEEFPELTERANNILGYSIQELCLKDPKKELNQTQFTQPALYVINAFSYIKRVNDSGQKPDFLVGHSLGEFNALLAAECFDFEAGLKLVRKRGELMSQASNGAMAAVLNASKEQIETILKENNLTNIYLANYNTPSQIVISGSREEIGKAQSFFQQGEMLYYPLNTSGAFHSRFMQASKEKFDTYIRKFKFAEPKIPVISNVTARPYQSDAITFNLSNQITSTVKWCESIQYLMELAASGTDPMEFEEIGNNDVLTKLVNTIKLQTPNSSNANIQVKKTPVEEATKKQVIGNENLDITQNRSSKVEDTVNKWNASYPIGTKVKSLLPNYEDLETRTKAIVLFGHKAAIYMKGYNGYFDLNEVTPG